MPTVDCYTWPMSGYPGETIHICARASERTTLAMEFYRLGGPTDQKINGPNKREIEYVTAEYLMVPPNADEFGCGWDPIFECIIPSTWRGGVYSVRFSLNGIVLANALFVVKTPVKQSTAKILYVLPIATFNAYNDWNGYSLYKTHKQQVITITQVSFKRPWANQRPNDESRPCDAESWFPFLNDKAFLIWLDDNKIQADYCTSIDLHNGSNLLDNYQLFLSVCHDEYWSKAMRDNVELFVAKGGNAAFFSGNVSWWQVRFANNDSIMVCFKDQADAHPDLPPGTLFDSSLRTTKWFDVPRSESAMTGVSFFNGAQENGSEGHPPDIVSYTVHHAEPWVFDGPTPIADGSKFGITARPPGSKYSVVGYETDGAAMDGTEYTNFQPLAEADLSQAANWIPWPNSVRSCATMCSFRPVPYPDNEVTGTVFTVGTTGWARGLDRDMLIPQVDQITKNVLKELSKPRAKRLPGQIPIFQFRSPKSRTDAAEFRFRLSTQPGGYGWWWDGVAFFTPPEGSPGAVAIYEKSAIGHINNQCLRYSTTDVEPGFERSVIAFYAYPVGTPNMLSIYEFSAPDDPQRLRYAINNNAYGWNGGRIVFCVCAWPN